MTSLMSMEDLFYGPTESTWILPERPRYRERQYDDSPPRQRYMEPLRPVERYMHHARPPVDPELRPVERRPRAMPPSPMEDLRPVERLSARVHTVPEPVPANIPEEIRKVVEVPVPSAVPPPTQVIMPAPAPPTQVITAPPPPVEVVAPAPPPPVQVVAPAPPVAKPRSVSPPRAIIHYPIEMKVPMCCEKCAKKVKERLLQMEGVENVITDQYNQKVTVHGRVDPSRVIERVKRVKKRSAFWDMTVDYSENYRRARAAEDAAIARESAKAATVKAEQVAEAKAMAAPIAPPPNVVVKLPQEPHGPQVTAILPPQQPARVLPFAVQNSNVHSQRYVSPPKAYRQELFHDGSIARNSRRH